MSRLLISLGGEAVLSQGGGDPSNTVASILGVLKRLLLPEMGDSAPLYIGQVCNSSLDREGKAGLQWTRPVSFSAPPFAM